MAMFDAMYFGGLRPGEAAGLREKDCRLPEKGWSLARLCVPSGGGRLAPGGPTVRPAPRGCVTLAQRGGPRTGSRGAGRARRRRDAQGLRQVHRGATRDGQPPHILHGRRDARRHPWGLARRRWERFLRCGLVPCCSTLISTASTPMITPWSGPRERSRGPSAYGRGIVPRGAGIAGLTWGNEAASIPPMFRDQWHAAASGGCRLHVRTGVINEERAGRTADRWPYLVGRVGLEPTTHGL